MDNLADLFGDFFKQKFQMYPDVNSPPRSPRPRGWFEEYRADAFKVVHNLELKTGNIWSDLFGRIYKLDYSQLSVTLAVYEQQTILWLDDHSSDLDFSEFLQLEQLINWLPHRLDEFLSVLLETKFNYLGRPRIINSAQEIPAFTEDQLARMTQSKSALRELSNHEKRMTAVKGQVKRPHCVLSPTDGFQIELYVWTKILGRVIRLRCDLGVDHSFKYAGVQLAEQVGNFFVPR